MIANRTQPLGSIIGIVLFCIVWFRFFDCRLFSDIRHYETAKDILTLMTILFFFPAIMKARKYMTVAANVSYLCIIFLLSALWSFLFGDQGFYNSTRALCGSVLPLVFFFILDYYKVSVDTIVKSSLVLCSLYTVALIIAVSTFPDPIFGVSYGTERSLNDFTTRGVLRIPIPGADFVPMIIFWILIKYRNKQKYYLLLIPLIMILLMRGTRTPFFATVLISLIYYVWQIKNNLYRILLTLIVCIGVGSVNEVLLDKKNDSILARYVQFTTKQIEKKGKEDIRIRMSKYYMSDFQKNVGTVILGNGVPRNSEYGEKVKSLAKKHFYYISDVGITNIFVYFGLVGVIAYALLLFKIIHTKLPEKVLFAKLFVYYLFLILPTNYALITSVIPLSMALYIIHKETIDTHIRKIILNEKNHTGTYM